MTKRSAERQSKAVIAAAELESQDSPVLAVMKY